MKTRLLLLTLLMVGYVVAQKKQTDCWYIILNNKTIAKNSFHKSDDVVLPVAKQGKLKLVYNCDNPTDSFNRSFIVMDINRKELLRVNASGNNNYSFISIPKLKRLTNVQSFSIYTISIPKDSLKAMTMRIAPILLTNVSWQ